MAYRIECDRCGKTQAVKDIGEMPSAWLQFNDLVYGDGRNVLDEPIAGGVFCRSCVEALAQWRRPIPRCEPGGFAA